MSIKKPLRIGQSENYVDAFSRLSRRDEMLMAVLPHVESFMMKVRFEDMTTEELATAVSVLTGELNNVVKLRGKK